MTTLKYKQLIGFAIYEGRRKFLADLRYKERSLISDQDVEDNFSLVRRSLEQEKGRVSDEEFKSYVETLPTPRIAEFKLPVITSRRVFDDI